MTGVICYDGRSMSKKKRNKVYKGSNAASIRPTITRVNAVNRHPAHQWWVDHKRVARPVLIVGGIAAGIILTIVGIISIFV